MSPNLPRGHSLQGSRGGPRRPRNNGKWTNANDGNLLALAKNYPPGSSKRPLFVSEGTSKAKLQTIGRSPYLSFCLNSLREDQKNTVVFGHALGEQDKHIIDAQNKGAPREVAVSIYPRTDDDQRIIKEKARITRLLGENKPRFFDSTTHPLGDPSLTIQQALHLAMRPDHGDVRLAGRVGNRSVS